jgi:uncharacterized alpha-E superfamily protein
MTQSCLKLATSEAMTVLGKINKDFLLYNGIYQVTMPRGLGWSFSRIGKHIERCLQTISMTQSYYEFNMILMARGFTVLEKIIISFRI